MTCKQGDRHHWDESRSRCLDCERDAATTAPHWERQPGGDRGPGEVRADLFASPGSAAESEQSGQSGVSVCVWT